MPQDYSNLSNEELARLANMGEYDCFPLLITRIMPHIKAQALKWKSVLPDTDDLISEGIVALFKAVKVYNSEKASFATFANLCVDRAIGAKLKSELSGKRIPGSMLVSIDEDMLSCESAEEMFIKMEESDILKQDMVKNLTVLEKNVLSLFLDGNSYADIAARLGVSVKSVDGALQRIRSKLKK